LRQDRQRDKAIDTMRGKVFKNKSPKPFFEDQLPKKLL
jgi:hypothetical protein